MRIDGSTVLLTGATGGIGGAVARELARRGASLILVGRDSGKLDALARELGGADRKLLPLAADIAVPGAAAAAVATAQAQAGDVDILINCAGVQTFGFFADEATADTAALFDINVVAPLAIIRALLPQMLRRRHGRIVNVGSIFGSIGFPCFASYSASKFALRGFSEGLRRELAGSGVGVSYVAPRFTRTAFNRSAVTRMATALEMNQDDPVAVAVAVVGAIERNGRNHYLGWPEKLFVRINALLPHLVDRPLMKQVEQMRPFATEQLP